MTKKRFHKLFRAWLVRANARNGADKGTYKSVMQHLNNFKSVDTTVATSYSELWKVITSNGEMTFGVGVKGK